MDFKQNLRNEIAYQGLQMKQVAADAGLSYGAFLAYVDHRERLPSVEIGVRIAKALGVSVEYLVTGKNHERSDNNMSKYLQFKDMLDELLLLRPDTIETIKVMIHAAAEREEAKKKRKSSAV